MKDNAADILTKTLSVMKFDHRSNLIRLLNCSMSIGGTVGEVNAFCC